MAKYLVSFSDGRRSEEFSSLAAVKAWLRVPGGPKARVFLSDWFTDVIRGGVYTQACCAYYSRTARDEDQEGAYAIRITQIPRA